MNEKEVLDIVQKKRKRAPRPEQTVQVDPKDLDTVLDVSMQIYNLPEIDTNDAKQVDRRFNDYMTICRQYGQKPSFAGFATALGVDRSTLFRWVNGSLSKPADVCASLKKAQQLLNSLIENWMQNGQINPVSGIFLMKNNFGYADKSEVVLTPNNPLGESRSQAELEQKYLDALPAEGAEGAEGGSAE